MSKNIYEAYDPNDAYTLLEGLFNKSKNVMELIHRMNATQVCVFAALCEGKRLTTVGNVVKEADIAVNNAPMIINKIRSLSNIDLGIEKFNATTMSGLGARTYQAVYFISPRHVKSLNKNRKQ